MENQRTFNRDENREMLLRLYPDFLPEVIEQMLDKTEYRERNLVFGNNVVHFRFSGSIIPEEEIPRFRELIKRHNYKLSYYNKDGVMMASAEDANSIGFDAIVFSLAQSGLYDVIKELVSYTWRKTRNGVIIKHSSDGSVNEYPTITTININVEAGKKLVYVFPNDFPEKTIDKALGVFPDVVVKHQELLAGFDRYYEHFKLRRNGNWKRISQEETIKKALKKNKPKRK